MIPLEIRKKLGLPEGAIMACSVEDGRIVLDPEFDERAKLELEDGEPVLVAPPGAPRMTPDLVRDLLSS